VLVAGTLLFFFPFDAPARCDQRTLTLAERVAYQRAIEDVYWRHRTWPKEWPDPKPSLDNVMTQAQLEKKVTDYLRKSQALDDYWQRAITAEQLQAEMDRMAKYSKQPDVLRELFEALGNDPFVIAECLARPVLSERSVADLSTPEKTRSFGFAPTKALHCTSMSASVANGAYTLPRIAGGDTQCIDAWTATATADAPSNRAYHTAVWTGSEMIVWGGYDGNNYFNTGGRYNPSTDSWTSTNTANAPTARYVHTAVWTGSEMIVWGGYNTGNSFNTGGRYNPSTDSWTATSTTNEPAARTGHTAVWTGSKMIVWGGDSGIRLNTGGRYNPSMDSWTATSTINAPEARNSHTAVWTDSEMIVWGGYDGNNELNTGGRYNPSTDSWTATNVSNAPSARDEHPAVWTGTEMIIWGGHSNDVGEFNTGGRYDPSMDSWAATTTANAPSARTSHTAVWSGSEMIIWAGYDGAGVT
jgi:N-acetylneuraminic acid mutarotase